MYAQVTNNLPSFDDFHYFTGCLPEGNSGAEDLC